MFEIHVTFRDDWSRVKMFMEDTGIKCIAPMSLINPYANYSVECMTSVVCDKWSDKIEEIKEEAGKAGLTIIREKIECDPRSAVYPAYLEYHFRIEGEPKERHAKIGWSRRFDKPELPWLGTIRSSGYIGLDVFKAKCYEIIIEEMPFKLVNKGHFEAAIMDTHPELDQGWLPLISI